MRELWAEFDALMPCPSCCCTESKKYMEHFHYQRLLQFLMGLNESYSQSSNQIMMITPMPSINKAYAMILSEESRRSFTSSPSIENSEGMALFSSTNTGRNGNNYPRGGRGGSGPSSGSYNSRPRRGDIVCDFCHLRGHTRNACYKLHGYPPDYKQKKRSGAESQSARDTSGSNGDKLGNVSGGSSSTSVNFVGISKLQQSGEFSQDPNEMISGLPQFTKEQYNKILQLLDSEHEGKHSAMAAGPLQWTGEGDW